MLSKVRSNDREREKKFHSKLEKVELQIAQFVTRFLVENNKGTSDSCEFSTPGVQYAGTREQESTRAKHIMVFEEQRVLHEDVERLEQAIADRYVEDLKQASHFELSRPGTRLTSRRIGIC